MIPVTSADLAAIHSVVSTESPRRVPEGHKDDLLGMAVAVPFGKTAGTEVYYTPFKAAASLMQEVIRLHPFHDGNKRTGLLAACVLLALNGIRIDLQPDAADVALKVAAKPDTNHIEWLAKWFEDSTY